MHWKAWFNFGYILARHADQNTMVMTRSATAKATIVYMVPKRIVKEEPKIWKRKESLPAKAKTEEPRPRNEGMRWDEEMGLKIYFELKTLSENKSISLEDAVNQIETAFYFHSWCMSEEVRTVHLNTTQHNYALFLYSTYTWYANVHHMHIFFQEG